MVCQEVGHSHFLVHQDVPTVSRCLSLPGCICPPGLGLRRQLNGLRAAMREDFRGGVTNPRFRSLERPMSVAMRKSPLVARSRSPLVAR